MATKTKPRTTKKPAAKPQRKPRTPRPANPSAEEIGCVIGHHAGYALASCLEDLLSLRDKPGFDAVSASAAEKLGDGVTGYRADYAADQADPARVRPVEEALRRLRDEISMAEIYTDMSMERLDSLLCPSPPAQATGGTDTAGPLSGELASLLNSFADRIGRDNARRTNLLDRLEL